MKLLRRTHVQLPFFQLPGAQRYAFLIQPTGAGGQAIEQEFCERRQMPGRAANSNLACKYIQPEHFAAQYPPLIYDSCPGRWSGREGLGRIARDIDNWQADTRLRVETKAAICAKSNLSRCHLKAQIVQMHACRGGARYWIRRQTRWRELWERASPALFLLHARESEHRCCLLCVRVSEERRVAGIRHLVKSLHLNP
jgi:hypothetical protein